jgi:hypothetical protein
MKTLFKLLTLPATAFALCATPAMAEIDHFFDYRFGVSYSDAPGGVGGRGQALYEGRYTTRFSHQTDSGVRFRFDLTVAVGNITDRRPPDAPPGSAQGNSVSIELMQ